MCGIFAYAGPRHDGAEIVLEGLKDLEYRGYDSWGVAAVPNTETKDAKASVIVVKKHTGKIGSAHVKDIPHSSFAFGHTRWATHGGVTDANAHPHLDCTQTIALIHNGIVENYEELKKKLIKKGHTFQSETDTEVVVHLIEEYAKTMMFSKAVQRAFNDLDGLNAFIAMSIKDDTFVAARNGSPLVIGFSDGANYLASDVSAILPYTKQVHYLSDDEMAIVSRRGVMIFNARTGHHVKPRKQRVDWTPAQAEKGKYTHFMLKEIYEQPGMIADIIASSASHAEDIAVRIKKASPVYLVGCGTANYACIAGSYLFSMVAKRQVNWAVGSEFSYHQDFLNKKSLVMALSQSGETMDTLEAIKQAKRSQARIFALVNVLGSTLYRLADDKTLIGAGPEKAVASTKAFTGKLAHLILMAYAASQGVHDGQLLLAKAVKSSKTVLANKTSTHIREIAKHIQSKDHIYVIGRGLSYPAALETALKIKEISYIHAEGFAAGELKHGVIALIEKGTPCIAFAPNDSTYGANLAGAMEMKARGGYIIGISHKPHDVFDVHIPVPDAGVATIIPNVIVGQLLAYNLAVLRGFDPDKPRNLAKSVTVK